MAPFSVAFIDSLISDLVDDFSPWIQGDLGPIYGFQWRHFGAKYRTMRDDYTGEGIDQLQQCIDLIKTDPSSRRIIMTAWNPSGRSASFLFKYDSRHWALNVFLSCRFGCDGVATLSLYGAVLCCRWGIILPIVPKERRYGWFGF